MSKSSFILGSKIISGFKLYGGANNILRIRSGKYSVHDDDNDFYRIYYDNIETDVPWLILPAGMRKGEKPLTWNPPGVSIILNYMPGYS